MQLYYNLGGQLDDFSLQMIARTTQDVVRYGGSAAAGFVPLVVAIVTWKNVYPNPCQYYKHKYNMTEARVFCYLQINI